MAMLGNAALGTHPCSGLPGDLGGQVEADVVVEDGAVRFVRGGRDKQVWTSTPRPSTVSPKRRVSPEACTEVYGCRYDRQRLPVGTALRPHGA